MNFCEFDVVFTLADILTRRAVFHIEKNTETRITSAVTKETAREEKPVLTFNLARKVNLTVIIAVILIGLALVYAGWRVMRGKKRRR